MGSSKFIKRINLFKLKDILKEANPSDIESTKILWEVIEVLPNHYRLQCIATYDEKLLLLGTTFSDIKEDVEHTYKLK
jgi:hypothetical protein